MKEIVALGDVVKVDRQAASTTECQQLPYIGLEHIESHGGLFAGFRPVPETLAATKFRFSPRHVLYGKLRPYLNKVITVDFDGVCTTEILPLLPHASKLDKGFLRALLKSSEFVSWASSNVSGANLPRLSPERLTEYRFYLPPLDEQRRIVAQLDKADRLRRMRRYAQTLSDTFLQSVFLEMFGGLLTSVCPSTPLGDLVEITGGGTPSRAITEFYQGSIPWVTSKDMTGTFVGDAQEHISEAAIGKSATKMVPLGSVLVVVKSKVLMHRLPLAITTKPLCHNQDIKAVLANEGLPPEFLMYLLKYNEPDLLRQARGANTEGLTLPMLEAIRVPDGHHELRRRFVKIVRQHQSLQRKQREASRQADHLFQSLLHRAFQTEK